MQVRDGTWRIEATNVERFGNGLDTTWNETAGANPSSSMTSQCISSGEAFTTMRRTKTQCTVRRSVKQGESLPRARERFVS